MKLHFCTLKVLSLRLDLFVFNFPLNYKVNIFSIHLLSAVQKLCIIYDLEFHNLDESNLKKYVQNKKRLANIRKYSKN